jgi:hypothetical protein
MTCRDLRRPDGGRRLASRAFGTITAVEPSSPVSHDAFLPMILALGWHQPVDPASYGSMDRFVLID